MAKILVVDDEVGIRSIVKKYAGIDGHEVVEAGDGLEAIALCKDNNFDIVIMDVMMPELDGYSAVTEIRKFSKVPIIMLSARVEEYDRLHGFEIGVDDYVVKPFSPRELLYRVNAILARTAVSSEGYDNKNSDVFEKGHLKVDFTARIVYVDGERIALSPKEYELLFFMVKNEGIALSRERLLREVWGYDFYGDDRTLDTHIKLLRRSLGVCGEYIVTLRGMGYRFEIA